MDKQELDFLRKQILETPEIVDDLPLEKVLELRKSISVYGNIIASSQKYANISVINWQDDYRKKEIITAMSDYLYQSAEDYGCDRTADEKQITNEDKQVILNFLNNQFKYDIRKHMRPSQDNEPKSIPADTMHSFNRYLHNNFDDIRKKTIEIYNIQPELEHAIIFYDSFETLEEAQKHISVHANEFNNDVYTVSNNGVTMLGAFKENVEKINFYNKNTHIFEEMMKQVERDHHLGKDLMEKRVKKKRDADITKFGKNPTMLEDYRNTLQNIAKVQNKLDALETNENEHDADEDRLTERLIQLKREKEMLEVPEDAIQVDTFTLEKDSDGKQIMVKNHFYTEAKDHPA